MTDSFSPAELRVLGALLEKEMATPEYYPLTLNALIAACNQKSNRDPVSHYEEEEVEEVIQTLRDRGMVMRVDAANSRTARFRHDLENRLNLPRPSRALLCVLFLRGPQTMGELRTRTSRLHPFADLVEVEEELDELMRREPPLLEKMAPQPGQKERRYRHRLSGDEEAGAGRREPSTTVTPNTPLPTQSEPGLADRVAELEARVARLEERLEG